MLSLLNLCSGSTGNATLVEGGGVCVLVDAGVACGTLENALRACGVEPSALSAVLITHEHIDHIRGAGTLARRHGVPLYANEATFDACARQLGRVPYGLARTFETGMDFYIGPMSVSPIGLPHDAADPVGYIIDYCGKRAVIATDLGHANGKFIDRVSGADAILLEANHDEALLKKNPHYSAALKKRIMGARGHLSNTACANALIALFRAGARHALLGHLSEENNTPEVAFSTVCAALMDAGIMVGRDMFVDVTYRDRSARRVTIA